MGGEHTQAECKMGGEHTQAFTHGQVWSRTDVESRFFNRHRAQGSNTEVWLNCLVSAGRSVCVGGGRLIRLLIIGCLWCSAERGCVAGVAWVGTLC